MTKFLGSYKVIVSVCYWVHLTLFFAFAFPVFAGVRVSYDYSSHMNPDAKVNDALANYFTPGGVYSIGGGVIFEGRASFNLESNENIAEVPISDLTLFAPESGGVFIKHTSGTYLLESHKEIACPLGKFIARGGGLVFTQPPERDDDAKRSMRDAGLVPYDENSFELIAREFEGTQFGPLLEWADYSEIERLPNEFEASLLAQLGSARPEDLGLDNEEGGSYINSDIQVRYKVFLVDESKQIDISGAPLRYIWQYGEDELPRVTSIAAISQEWSGEQSLADLSAGESATQYDFVAMWQVAGVFREFYLERRDMFEQFVSAACLR